MFPRVDAERVVLYDNFLSSIFLGRFLATIAEISFALQISSFNWIIVSQIVLAQMFCWISVITRNPFYHIIEESLWTLSAIIFLLLQNTFLASFFTFCYIMYMSIIDIPMYIKKYYAFNEKSFGLVDGLEDCVLTRNHISDWKFWRQEAMWMTPYFTLAVWTTQWIY